MKGAKSFKASLEVIIFSLPLYRDGCTGGRGCEQDQSVYRTLNSTPSHHQQAFHPCSAGESIGIARSKVNYIPVLLNPLLPGCKGSLSPPKLVRILTNLRAVESLREPGLPATSAC